MIIAERTFNFSLSSFGPIAGAIILLLLGLMIYRLLYFAGMKGVGAASLAYIILPGIFPIIDNMEETRLDDGNGSSISWRTPRELPRNFLRFN